MKRKFLKELEYWEEKNIDMPLLIIGARQTGKTYIIKEFCEQHYKNYIYLNFEDKPQLCEFFEGELIPEKIIKNIEGLLGKNINPEDTAIFFDEIQICERAITSLKYFCESKINYRIICAGSLLGVKLHRFQSSFPVGKVLIKNLYPMDFEEFLWANGEEKLVEIIKECLKNKHKMLDALHIKALEYYQDYLLVGGMPRAIIDYINSEKNVMNFNKDIHKSIIDSYIADMRKYTTSAAETIKISDIYESIPRQLAKDNTKFKFNIIKLNANKRDYELPLDWLISGDLVYKAKKVDKMQSPLKAYINENNFKIYLSDVGLLSTMAGVTRKDIEFNEDNIFKGALTENYVAQMLKSKGVELYYFKPTQNMEIDFAINLDGNIIPIEIKSGTHKKSNSLKSYIEKYKPKYAIKVSANNFGITNNIFSIPLYAIFAL